MRKSNRSAEPETARGLRRSVLSTTLATVALATVTGGGAGFALAGGDRLVTRPLAPGPASSPTAYSTTTPAYPPPLVVPAGRERDASRGGRWVGADPITDIPGAALAAYQRSETVLDEAAPDCRLRWTLLAAVGRILTDHGDRGHGDIGHDGLVQPAIIRAPLVARDGTKAGDTDGGLLDGDRRFDRPVGPMLLTPSDWSVVGVDGDADGDRNPQDVDDAALSLAVVLCAAGEDLGTREGRRRALRWVDDAPGFARAVLEVEASYREELRQGVEVVEVEPPTTMPTLPTPPSTWPRDRTQPPTDTDRRNDAPRGPSAGPGDQSEPPHEGDQGDGGELPDPPEPEPDPEPDPEPEPEPDPEPEPVETTTEVTATYDADLLQIVATAAVSADEVTTNGEVVFILTRGADQVVVAELGASLSEGTATVTFPDVTEPGEYTVVAEFAGNEGLAASSGSVVLEVTVPPTGPSTSGPKH